jgi:hypothetical protein
LASPVVSARRSGEEKKGSQQPRGANENKTPSSAGKRGLPPSDRVLRSSPRPGSAVKKNIFAPQSPPLPRSPLMQKQARIDDFYRRSDEPEAKRWRVTE